MAARGQRETAQLRVNAEEQISRLMTQLSDLEELREARAGCYAHARSALCPGASPDAQRAPRLQDMEADEYESTKSETLKQLEEFHASLSRMMARPQCHAPHAALRLTRGCFLRRAT
jgi:hypothetical protein